MKNKRGVFLLLMILCLTACGTTERETGDVVSAAEDETDKAVSDSDVETEKTVSETITDDASTETFPEYTESAEINENDCEIDETTLIPWEGDVDANFIGVWHRTNCHSGIAGTIAMGRLEKETHGGIKGNFIHFKGEFIRGGNFGLIEGEALFISENEAVYTCWEALEDPNAEYDAYLIFHIDDSGMHVSLQGDNDRLGFGQGVSATGDYIKTSNFNASPVYNR